MIRLIVIRRPSGLVARSNAAAAGRQRRWRAGRGRTWMLHSSENCVRRCHLFKISLPYFFLPRVADNDAALSTPPYGEDAGHREGNSESGDKAGETRTTAPGSTWAVTEGRPAIHLGRPRFIVRRTVRQSATTSRRPRTRVRRESVVKSLSGVDRRSRW